MNQVPARMRFLERTTLLEFVDTATVTISVGMRGLAEDVLHHDPTTPAELERAIDLIEDALAMSRLPIVDRGSLLIECPPLRTVPGFDDHGFGLERGAIEALFQLLASRAHGTPIATAELPHGRNIAGALLILRECMHHLGFNHVGVLRSSG